MSQSAYWASDFSMSHFQLQAVAIKEKIKMAIHEYLQIKKPSRQTGQLDVTNHISPSKTNNTMTAKLWKQLKQTEASKQVQSTGSKKGTWVH